MAIRDLAELNATPFGRLLASVLYDEFVRLHGERGKAFLDALGIVRVPANEVTLDPILLGKRFRRHAEKVVMDRYGVKRTNQTTAQK